MTSIVRSTLLMVMGAIALAAPVRADAHRPDSADSDDRGAYVGFSGMASLVLNQSSAPVNGFIDQGGGFGVFVGGRLGYMIALEGGYVLNIHNPVHNWMGDTIDALLLQSGTLDLKVLFPNRSPFCPYFQGGLGLYELVTFPDRGEYRFGLGFQLGGGLDVWVARGVSIGARALYHGISFTQNIGASKPFLSTLSLEGNLQLHF